MTPLKKILVAAAGLILVIFVLQETVVLDINHYLVVFKSSENSTLSTETSTVIFEGQPPIPKRIVSRSDLSFVVLLGKDTLYKELNKLEPIVIRIDSLQTGPLWMPLLKSAEFSAVCYPKFAGNEKGTPFVFSGETKTSMSGRLKIAGTVDIKGICSRKEANIIIKDFIVKSFMASTKSIFDGTSADYLQGIAWNRKIKGNFLNKER